MSITIVPGAPHPPPTADPQCVFTPKNTAVPIVLTGSDPDGDALTYAVVTGPSHGTLSGTAPTLTYTPEPGYTGPDSFTFTVNDGRVNSNAATVSITVTKPAYDATCRHRGKYGQGDCTWWHVPKHHDRLRVVNRGQGWVSVTVWVNGKRLYFSKLKHGAVWGYNLARYMNGNGRDVVTSSRPDQRIPRMSFVM